MSTKIKIFLALIVFVFFSVGICCWLAFSRHQDNEKQASLIVGVDADRPPFAYRDADGVLTGFNVELSREICRMLNRNCEFKTYEIAQFAEAVRQRQADIALSELVHTPSRMQEFAFSMVYYRSRSFFITASSQVHNLTFANAKNLRIGVRSKSRQWRFLQETYAVKGSEIRAYPTYQDMVSALKAGEVNALLVCGSAGYMILTSPMGQSLFAGGFPEIATQGLDEFRILSRKSDCELIEQINQALFELYSNGKFREISLRYLPADHLSQTTYSWFTTRE